MNIPKPHDASEALKQAKVQDRANRLFAEGYRAAYLPEGDVILVTNEEKTTYRVGVVFDDCDCPFYGENDYCKHVLGAQRLLQQSIAEQQEIAEADSCEMSLEAYRRFNNPFDGE